MTLGMKCRKCGPARVKVLELTTGGQPYKACRVQCPKCHGIWASRSERAILAGMGFTNALAALENEMKIPEGQRCRA